MLQRFTPEETPETKLYDDITLNINTALTILFSIECLLKIFGFGLRVNICTLNDVERFSSIHFSLSHVASALAAV